MNITVQSRFMTWGRDSLTARNRPIPAAQQARPLRPGRDEPTGVEAAQVTKATRQGGAQSNGTAASGADDPWAAAPASGGYDDEPPF